MRIYRPAYSKPLPAGSKIKQDKAGKYIVQTDRQGQPKKARVLDMPMLYGKPPDQNHLSEPICD